MNCIDEQYCSLELRFLFWFVLALSVSDPSFRSHELSWMSFAAFHIRKKTHIQLQFRPLSADGILFYVAQHLKAQSGKVGRIFVCKRNKNASEFQIVY